VKTFRRLLKELDCDALDAALARCVSAQVATGRIMFTVKENIPALFDEIDALAWEAEPTAWTTSDRAHGRDELRTIKVLPASAFRRKAGHAHRAVRHRPQTGKRSAVAVPAVTNLIADQADPETLIALVRGHWQIEVPHWLRDSATFREDTHKLKLPAPESPRPCGIWQSTRHAWPTNHRRRPPMGRQRLPQPPHLHGLTM
jgi:hypothetical protein